MKTIDEIEKVYATDILREYYFELIEAKRNDGIIVPITDFTQEFFPLSDKYLNILIRLLDRIHYFERIKTKTNTYYDLLDQ